MIILKNYNNKIINFIFCLYPLTFILGNTALNINTIIFILLAFFFFKKDIIQIDLKSFDKYIIIFFIYIFLVLIINIFEINFYKTIDVNHFKNFQTFLILKSLFFLRYLFLYFVIRYLIEKKVIKFKYFFLSSLAFCLFVSFDIIFQFLFGKDIFGLTPIHPRKLSGPFGEELIAGGFLQKFFLFLISFIVIFYNSKKNYLLIFLLPIIFFAMILAGNRMSLIMTIFGLLLLLIFLKQIRKLLISTACIMGIIFFILFSTNTNVKNNFASFGLQIYKISKNLFSDKIDREQLPPYYDEFESFYDTWQLNKYFGGGLKSFRIYCPYRKNIEKGERHACNSHPHNYYLETFAELGLFGIVVLIVFLYKTITISFKNYFECKKNSKKKIIILTFLILFLLEMFPLKNTGSFFSTSNSTYIFILIGSLMGLQHNNKNKTI